MNSQLKSLRRERGQSSLTYILDPGSLPASSLRSLSTLYKNTLPLTPDLPLPPAARRSLLPPPPPHPSPLTAPSHHPDSAPTPQLLCPGPCPCQPRGRSPVLTVLASVQRRAPLVTPSRPPGRFPLFCLPLLGPLFHLLVSFSLPGFLKAPLSSGVLSSAMKSSGPKCFPWVMASTSTA